MALPCFNKGESMMLFYLNGTSYVQLYSGIMWHEANKYLISARISQLIRDIRWYRVVLIEYARLHPLTLVVDKTFEHGDMSIRIV